MESRVVWAEYLETQRISYAFFSATDAAAALEQAEKYRRRDMGENVGVINEDIDEEDEDHDEEELYESGEEVETDGAGLPKDVAEVTLEDGEEDGWSTEGESEDNEMEDGEKRLARDQTLPPEEEVREVGTRNGVAEDIRTRVLSVAELEDLFENAAPNLKRASSPSVGAYPFPDFVTPREPYPEKLIVGLVGYPNVGKSSTINALLGAKKVSVSSTPGKTKHFQTLVLSDHVTLCDCPGLVFPQFANTQADMVVDGILPIDQMKEYSAPVDLVCHRIPQEILEQTYGIRIDIKLVEDGGSGQVGWEDLLSTYASK